jgi:hypothetical protein
MHGALILAESSARRDLRCDPMMQHLTAFCRWSRYCVAAPCTALGLALVVVALPFGARMRVVDGALECCFPRDSAAAVWFARRQPFAAITLGHIIFALTARDLRHWHAHERVHVRQFEAWGPMLLLAYPAASAWAWLRGHDPYMGNFFEQQAYLEKSELAVVAPAASIHSLFK